jgi:hypothetical protein
VKDDLRLGVLAPSTRKIVVEHAEGSLSQRTHRAALVVVLLLAVAEGSLVAPTWTPTSVLVPQRFGCLQIRLINRWWLCNKTTRQLPSQNYF